MLAHIAHKGLSREDHVMGHLLKVFDLATQVMEAAARVLVKQFQKPTFPLQA